jgi:ribosome-associated protein
MANPDRPRRARPGPPSHHQHDESEDDYGPSRTQMKRESDALQKLGEELLELPDSRLAAIAMPDILRFALRDAKKITAHGGRRRQLQYIGKLMRQVEPEPYQQAVAAFKLGHAQDQLRLHQLEALREELIASDEALQRYIAEHPSVDVQQLRSLIRSARKDAAAQPESRSGRGFRELFQFLKAQPDEIADA